MGATKDGQAPSMTGQQVGNYVIEAEIGVGGMARVYRARHVVLRTVHAVKVLAPEYRVREEVRERFLSEGRIAARIDHPNIVKVTDTISTPEVAGLVMEFVDGQSLEQFIEALPAPPPLQTVIDLFLPILDAIGEAHRQGIIHRDIKPANIILHRHGGRLVPKVTDFGIAKVTDVAVGLSEGKRATQADARMGTLAYMSPEQIRRAAEVTPRSDIFSLGATLYELATGHVAFHGASDFDVMKQIVDGHFERPELRGADAWLGQVIVRALQPAPEHRFATCEEFGLALRGYAHPTGAPAGFAVPVAALPEQVPPTAPVVLPSLGGSGRDVPDALPIPRRRGVKVAVGLGVLALAKVLVAVATSESTPATGPAPDGNYSNSDEAGPAAVPAEFLPRPPCESARAIQNGEPLTRAEKLADSKPVLPADSSYYESAVGEAKRATVAAPECAGAWFVLSRALYLRAYDVCGAGDYSAAEEAGRRALTLEVTPKGRAVILRTLARIAAAGLNWDLAEALFAEASRLAPGNSEAKILIDGLVLRRNPSLILLQAIDLALTNNLLGPADLISLSVPELTVLVNAPAARNGRRFNVASLDWLYYCEGSPIARRSIVNPNAARDPYVKGSNDWENAGLISAARKAR